MKKAETKSSKGEKHRNILRKSGLKTTSSRLAVLKVFEHAKCPLSAQAVIDRLHANTDRATLYRIIQAFKKAGIIRQIDLRHNHAHYELADLNDHHHVTCLSCGRIEEIQGCDLDSMGELVLRQAKHFAEIQDHSLEFYGFCDRCKHSSTAA